MFKRKVLKTLKFLKVDHHHLSSGGSLVLFHLTAKREQILDDVCLVKKVAVY